MIASDIRLTAERGMALTTPYCPAFVRMKRHLLSRGGEPLGNAAHLPGIAVKDIEPARDPRGDIGGKQLRHVDNIGKVLTPLQPLRHAGQQFADSPVGVALFFQPLPGKAVFTKNTDRLRHIANLINLIKIRRFDGVILRRQTVYHVAETHHGAQHSAFQDKAQDKQKQQGGQANHQFRGRTQRFRFFGGILHGRNHPLVEDLAKVINLVLRAFQCLLIGGTIKQGNGLSIFSPLCTGEGRLLFIL